MSPTTQPSTPASRYPLHETFRPRNPSPLASPSPSRSSALHPRWPPSSISEHRRRQFKSQSITPTRPTSPPHTLPSRARSISSSAGAVFTSSSPQSTHTPLPPPPAFNHPEDPQKSFLRARIRAKCLERAQKARARAVKKRRYTGYSDRSSDGFDPEDDTDTGPSRGGNLSILMDQGEDEEDEEENDDDIMNDELFRRIMAQTNRKTDHSYRVSYALEVGSSFDPSLEDVAAWEHELTTSLTDGQLQGGEIPADLADEELDAYAEECARQAVLDDFADIPEEELFHLSDIDDVLGQDEGMDIS